MGKTMVYLFDRDKGCLRRGRVKLKVPPLITSQLAGNAGGAGKFQNVILFIYLDNIGIV